MIKEEVARWIATLLSRRPSKVPSISINWPIARLDSAALARLVERLPVLMAEREMSGRELARRSHVSINTVRQTLRGRSSPSIGKILAYATALGTTVDLLFGAGPVEALVSTVTTEPEAIPHEAV